MPHQIETFDLLLKKYALRIYASSILFFPISDSLSILNQSNGINPIDWLKKFEDHKIEYKQEIKDQTIKVSNIDNNVPNFIILKTQEYENSEFEVIGAPMPPTNFSVVNVQ